MKLENWKLGLNDDNEYSVIGTIYGDKEKKFDDGTLIVSSSIIMIDFEKSVVKTKNSTYKLGKQDTACDCGYCGQPTGSSDPDVLCKDCQETFGHAFLSEL